MTAALLTEAPLCFDTNSIWGEREAPRHLRRIRRRFPRRRLLIPAWVVAERVRQLSERYGDGFEPSLIAAFLDDETTSLEVVPFSRDVSVGAWRKATAKLSRPWDWKGGQDPTERPCAERCRSGDYIVYATAIAHGAVLVTDDTAFAEQAARGDLIPGVASMADVLAIC